MTEDTDNYRVVLLTKAGIGSAKREVLSRLATTEDITVAGIIVEDLIHGTALDYARNLFQNIIRRRGRGYPVRAFNAARDVFWTLRSRLVSTNDDTSDSEFDGVLSDVPTIEVSDMLNKNTERHLRELDPDLAIVWGTRILPQRIFDIPTDGSIGIHAGKIPEYRGGPAGFWELYNDEDEAGVTVQQLADELDAGQILRQETVPIKSDDTPADIRARQHEITPDLVVEAVKGVAAGTLEPREWDGTKRPVNTPPTLAQLARFWLRHWKRSK